MVKSRLAPPKCLFHAATQIEKIDITSTQIEQLAHFDLVKNWQLLTPHNYITSS